MKKNIILIILILLYPIISYSADYYVSSSTGSDGNAGTFEAPFAKHPWDATASGNSNDVSLNGGDIVYMKNGDTWWDTSINTESSGYPTTPILTTAYGEATNPPKITGSLSTLEWDTGWSLSSGTIYTRTCTTNPTVLVYNETILINCGTTNPSTNEFYWVTNTLYVNIGTNPSSTTAWLCSKTNNPLLIDQNYVTFKDIDIECGNSASVGVVYITPNTGQTGIILDGLNIKYGAVAGVTGTPILSEIKNCNISNIMTNLGTYGVGIKLTSSNTSKYYNNTISNVYTGIMSILNTTPVEPNLIYNNTITNIKPYTNNSGVAVGVDISAGNGWQIYNNTIHGLGNRTGSSGASGIYILNSNQNLIYSNTIYDSRYYGIIMSDSDSNKVYNNEIYNCGAKNSEGTDFIYYGAGNGEGGEGIRIGASSENNIIYNNNVHGNYVGIINQTNAGVGNNIYKYNLISDSIVNGIGISSDGNPTYPNIIANNTIIHNSSVNNTPPYRGHGLYLQSSTVGGGNAIFANNLIYMKVKGIDTHGIWITDDALTDIVSLKIDNNLIYATEDEAQWGNVIGTAYTSGTTYKLGIPTKSTKITGLDGIQANAESHAIITNPNFVSSSDFNLQITSPAINTGNYISDVHKDGDTDVIGNEIDYTPKPDIGAYGYVPKNTMLIIGDSICNTWSTDGTQEQIYDRIKNFYSPLYPILPTSLEGEVMPYLGGYYGLTIKNWATNTNVCENTVTNGTSREYCLTESGAKYLIILGLGYNDVATMYDDSNYPLKFESIITYMENLITHAQSQGMQVVYMSHYPLSIDVYREVGDGTGDVDDCTDVPSCKLRLNKNYHLLQHRLKTLFIQMGVTYIDFFMKELIQIILMMHLY